MQFKCEYCGCIVSDDMTKCPNCSWPTINPWQKSITLGDAEDLCNIGMLYYDGICCLNNSEKAVVYFKEAAELGNIQAQYKLGEYYYHKHNYIEAVGWYTKATKQDHQMAQARLANCYSYGQGIERNITKAIKIWMNLSEKENVHALYEVGEIYRIYSFRKNTLPNYAEAVKWYLRAAEQGDSDAEYQLGLCCKEGRGIEKNEEEAIKWIRKAAEKGNFRAQRRLGQCYEKGDGVTQNYEEAAKWYEEAVSKHHHIGYISELDCNRILESLGYLYYYGKGVKKDTDKAFKCWHKASSWYFNLTSHKTEYHLGKCYYNGEGTNQNYEYAIHWFSKAALGGYVEAQRALGECYYFGDGVTLNYIEAVRLFKSAAKQGDAISKAYLGICYYEGRGVTQNYKEAVNWLNEAISNDFIAIAYYYLGMCFKDGKGTNKDESQAVSKFTFASTHGNTNATYEMGKCYIEGRGVDKDVDKAEEYFRNAAKQGHDGAKKALKKIEDLKSEKKRKEMLEQALRKDYEERAARNTSSNTSSSTKYLFFDTETTGLPRDYNAPSSAINNWPRLVQLSWILSDSQGNIISKENHIIKPEGFTIPQSASNLHKITTEQALKEGKDISFVLMKFVHDLGVCDCLVGHNVSFDKHIVGAELIRLGLEDYLDNKKSICTMKTTTNFCKIPGTYNYKYPTLQELYYKLFGCNFANEHDSLADIEATFKCFWQLKGRGII